MPRMRGPEVEPGAPDGPFDISPRWPRAVRPPAAPNTRGATLGRRYFVRRMPASKKGAKGWYSLEHRYALDSA